MSSSFLLMVASKSNKAAATCLQAPSALKKKKDSNDCLLLTIEKEHKQGNIISISASPSIQTLSDPCSDQGDIKEICLLCMPTSLT